MQDVFKYVVANVVSRSNLSDSHFVLTVIFTGHHMHVCISLVTSMCLCV